MANPLCAMSFLGILNKGFKKKSMHSDRDFRSDL